VDLGITTLVHANRTGMMIRDQVWETTRNGDGLGDRILFTERTSNNDTKGRTDKNAGGGGEIFRNENANRMRASIAIVYEWRVSTGRNPLSLSS
jgi:hypothetical protein